MGKFWGHKGICTSSTQDVSSPCSRRITHTEHMENEGLPGVPSKAALAPARVKRPPSFRCFVAKWLEMVDVHILCFHIRSQFLKRAGEWDKNNMSSSSPEKNPEGKLNSYCLHCREPSRPWWSATGSNKNSTGLNGQSCRFKHRLCHLPRLGFLIH